MSANSLNTTKQVGDAPAEGIPMVCLAPRGLAIYPVRYAVVPDSNFFKGIELPGHMGKKFDAPLKNHKYALRQLRKGFIYVYYHNHPTKKNKKWDIYQVREDGKLNELAVAKFKSDREIKSVCAGLTHFYIEKPVEHEKVDFAFSEHQWSTETLDLMEKDGAIRDLRMQTLRPGAWVDNPKFPHGLTLTEDNLKKVFEFSEEFEAYNNFHPDMIENKKISDDKGKHDRTVLELCSSTHPFKMSADDIKEIVQEINITPNNPKNQPMILGLWDAVGVVRDLGGYAMDAAGWVNQYQEKWALQLNAVDNIKMVKASLEAVAKAKNEKRPDAVSNDGQISHIEHQERLITQKMKRVYEPSYLEMGYTPDQFATIPDEDYQKLRNNLETLREAKKRREQQLQNYREKNDEKRIANSWKKYKDEIVNEDQMTAWEQNHKAIVVAAQPLVESRVNDLVSWLESPFLVNALTEYHQNSLIDGLFFEDLMGDLFSCMNGCDSGVKKLEDWVKAAAITDDNFFWRAIASNQIEGKDFLTPVLAKINSNSDLLAENKTIAGIGKDTYDRLLDIVKLNADSIEVADKVGDIAGQKIPTGGIEKIYSALGSRLITPIMKPGMDTIGSFITGLVYKAKLKIDIREEVEKYQQQLQELDDVYNNRQSNINKVITLSRQQGQAISRSRHPSMRNMLGVHQGNLSRAQNQLRFTLAQKKHVFSNVQISYADTLEQVTSTNQDLALKTKEMISAPGTAFGVLILAMQTASIRQLLTVIDAKGLDPELATKLTVAATGMAATMAGLVNNFTAKNSYWDRALKQGGGRLMVVAGVLSAGLDFADVSKQFSKGNSGAAGAYLLKGGSNLVAAGFAYASVYAAINTSWEAAWAARLQPAAARMGWEITKKAVLSRLLFVFSVGVGIFVLAIDIAIMLFADDDLQDWLQRTPFAKKPEGNIFTSVKDQQKIFENTIEEIFGLKNLDKELSRDGHLMRLKEQERQLAHKDKYFNEEHHITGASEADITNDKQYQRNRNRLETVRQRIEQRKHEVATEVTQYNTQ